MEPATLLPWKVVGDQVHQVRPDSDWMVADCHDIFDGLAETANDNGHRNAAYIVHAANLYPELVEVLRDPCMMPALEAWAKGCNANAVRCLENARAVLAKCDA